MFVITYFLQSPRFGQAAGRRLCIATEDRANHTPSPTIGLYDRGAPRSLHTNGGKEVDRVQRNVIASASLLTIIMAVERAGCFRSRAFCCGFSR